LKEELALEEAMDLSSDRLGNNECNVTEAVKTEIKENHPF